MAVLERFSDREPDYWRYRARQQPLRDTPTTPPPDVEEPEGDDRKPGVFSRPPGGRDSR